LNSTWASWVYDNPGIDSDSDGYYGKFRIKIDTIPNGADTTYEVDTVYYEGDGVPDFDGPPPPPPPQLRYTAVPGIVSLRWNGLETETYLDLFSQKQDFEGYRLYMSKILQQSGFALISSIDQVDYNRFRWDFGKSKWFLTEIPFTLDSLKELYGQDFDPLVYPEDNPYNDLVNEERYYFESVDWNQELGSDPRGIKKVFQDEIDAGIVTPDSSESNYFIDEISGESLHKYYEYKYTIDGLVPSEDLYFAVTAFDFGNPENGLDPLESSPLSNALHVYPIYSADRVAAEGVKVSVYPNPYRIDAGYTDDGYEDVYDGDERHRRIHFVNLPEQCTIKIWTLDGDMVREIGHCTNYEECPFSETNSKAYWDLISKNTQAIVSGIYIYSIESDQGTQLGKIVIIK